MAASVLVLILVADLAFTLPHSWQEWKGAGAPLWRNFGAIVGLEIPDRLGFLGFTAGLTLILCVVGFIAILGPLSDRSTAFALGALIGARLSDTLVSHLLLHAIGYRPNPGLSSTSLYVLEACFLAFIFWDRLAADPLAAKIGFAFGVVAFVLVLPSLWLARLALPQLRRPPWTPGQPMPSWASMPPKP
jgi:hypothetical protein